MAIYSYKCSSCVILKKLIHLFLFDCNSNVWSGKIAPTAFNLYLPFCSIPFRFVRATVKWRKMNDGNEQKTPHNNKVNKVRVGSTHIVYSLILLRSNNTHSFTAIKKITQFVSIFHSFGRSFFLPLWVNSLMCTHSVKRVIISLLHVFILIHRLMEHHIDPTYTWTSFFLRTERKLPLWLSCFSFFVLAFSVDYRQTIMFAMLSTQAGKSDVD